MDKPRLTMPVRIPSLPNFLRFEANPDVAIPIEDFTDRDLRAVGVAWTKELVAHAKARREAKKAGKS